MRRWDAFRAERTLGGGVRRDFEAPQRFDRNVEVRRAARAVDKHRSPHNVSARRTDRVERFLHRAARGHDVVHDEDALAGPKREPAAELAPHARLAAFRIDRPHAELSCDLVREDDSPGRRTCHGFDLERSRPGRDRRTESLRLGRVLKDLELFQVER
jgi:hypothetical protein